MAILDLLEQGGLHLPEVFEVPFAFERVRVTGNHAYISGHGPIDGSEVLMRGKVGADLTAEQGCEAARLTALSVLASLEHELGSVERVIRWVKVLGFVNCAPGFNETPRVVSGFSHLVIDLWDQAGLHARSAIGVAELPFDMPVEVEAIVEVAI
jgi:enamine deaminase RidA (YjgF/YER057c/UK114 family)